MVKHFDIELGEEPLQTSGEVYIAHRRFRDTGRVVMRENHFTGLRRSEEVLTTSYRPYFMRLNQSIVV